MFSVWMNVVRNHKMLEGSIDCLLKIRHPHSLSPSLGFPAYRRHFLKLSRPWLFLKSAQNLYLSDSTVSNSFNIFTSYHKCLVCLPPKYLFNAVQLDVKSSVHRYMWSPISPPGYFISSVITVLLVKFMESCKWGIWLFW